MEPEHWTAAGMLGLGSAIIGGIAMLIRAKKEARMAAHDIEENEKDKIIARCESMMSMQSKSLKELSSSLKAVQGDVRQLQMQHKECEEQHKECERQNEELKARVTELEKLLGAK